MKKVNQSKQIMGRIKWFKAKIGFGFIVPDDGGEDILIHINVLRNYGLSTIADDTPVQVRAIERDGRWQAVAIMAAEQKLMDYTCKIEFFEDLDVEYINKLPFQPARVKWFSLQKGFGFVNVFGRDVDVFLHLELLREIGLEEVRPGEAIAVRVHEGPRGFIAVGVSEFFGNFKGIYISADQTVLENNYLRASPGSR